MHDDKLARYMCLSVCYEPVLYRNGSSPFGLEATYPRLTDIVLGISKIRVLPSENSDQTLDLFYHGTSTVASAVKCGLLSVSICNTVSAM